MSWIFSCKIKDFRKCVNLELFGEEGSGAQARVRAISDIVQELIQGVKDGKDVDLNQIKKEVMPLLVRPCVFAGAPVQC